MGDLLSLKNVSRAVGVTLGVALVTALLFWLHINSTAAGVVFLTLVVWFATRAGMGLSLFVALECALSFDYFFLPPIFTFRLQGAQQWVEMFSFAVSSVVVGRVAALARQQTQQAQQRTEDVERLYTLSQEMMLHEDAGGLMRSLPQMIEKNFALDAVVLYVRDQDRIYGSAAGLDAGLEDELRGMTQGQMTVVGEFAALGLMLGLKNIGALAWRPATLSREAATAVGAQVAIALTRAVAIETFTRMEAAREGERLRSALIDSLTHELRTPLTGIRAAATTLVAGQGLDDATRQELAELLDEESARLDRLIGEAVDMAEIDAKVMRVHPVPMYLRSLLDHAVQESRSALTGHRVAVEAADAESPARFDARLLGRVLRHLLENAARYSPPGSTIRLGARRSEGRLEFSVADNGPGIDAADLPHIFEKFYRGRRVVAKSSGSGMGLSIARAIVEAHGGGIEVKPASGHGAVFEFWVPVEKQGQGNRDEGQGL